MDGIGAEDVWLPRATRRLARAAAPCDDRANRHGRALVVAASNAGVDQLMGYLHSLDVPAVRVGHPSRVRRSLVGMCLDTQVERHASGPAIQRHLNAAAKLMRQAPGVSSDSETLAWYTRQARQHEVEARKLQRAAVGELLTHTTVVCSTCVGSGSARSSPARYAAF